MCMNVQIKRAWFWEKKNEIIHRWSRWCYFWFKAMRIFFYLFCEIVWHRIEWNCRIHLAGHSIWFEFKRTFVAQTLCNPFVRITQKLVQKNSTDPYQCATSLYSYLFLPFCCYPSAHFIYATTEISIFLQVSISLILSLLCRCHLLSYDFIYFHVVGKYQVMF